MSLMQMTSRSVICNITILPQKRPRAQVIQNVDFGSLTPMQFADSRSHTYMLFFCLDCPSLASTHPSKPSSLPHP